LVQALVLFVAIGCTQTHQSEMGWDKLESILDEIKEPSFPDKEFNITTYGAVGDGLTDCSNAIKDAIEQCNANGGGKVLVPEGIFLTGAIYLKSNVNLYISDNATLKFSEDKSKYLPVVFTRWEGVECMNYSALIYAYGEENIAITGNGILDGQGSSENWWSWKGNKDSGWMEGMQNQKKDRDLLFQLAENNGPPEKRIFGEGHYLRPNFVQSYKCKNILIEGVTIKNSPMWFIHPVLCENVSVKNVTVEGLGPNNDGCNPESSRNVLIQNCFFNTGDDCIAIKSGRNTDGRRINVPSENIIIQDCSMKEGHGGVVIGSEISGGVKNVFAENCVMSSPNLDRAIRIKTNAVRGGLIENIFVRNISVGQVKEAVIKINFYYEEGENGSHLPIVKNLNFSNITSEKSEYAIWIKAFNNSPVENIRLSNCNFKNVEKENLIENVKTIVTSSVIINDKPLLIE
ncbi:MAG TPA: glycoside hydrolase family 28 protein, partial [Ignavibacteriaceae bacterium]